MKRLTPWNLPLSGILALALAACGGGDTETPDLLECGPGTELSGGACVLADSTCGAGLTLNEDDQCVPTDELCGDDTVYDTASKTCVGPDAIVCGEGTVEIDGRCLVDNPLTCGENTVLADGRCQLVDDVCGEGTQLENAGCAVVGETVCADRTVFDVALGRCVDLGNVECGDDTFEVDNRCISVDTVADNLASSADVVFEKDGENALTLPEAGTSLVFAGTIEADEGGEHQYTLSAQAGDWIELTVYTRGLPSPMAILTNDDGYDRATSSAQARVGQRTFALPTNGDYTLTIANALNQLSGTANSGDGSWAYVAQLSRVDAPAPKPWPGLEEVVNGDLSDLTENLYQVEFAEDYNFSMNLDVLGEDARAVVDQWASLSEWTRSTSVQEGGIFVPVRPASSEPVFLLFDLERQTGPDTAFEISTDRAVDVENGDTYEFEVTTEPGQVIKISYTTSNPSSFDVLFAVSQNGEQLANYTNTDPLNGSSFTPRPKERYFFGADGGTYTIAMTNNNWSAALYNFVPVITIIDPTPITVSGDQSFSFVREEELEEGALAFYRLDIDTPASFEGFLRTGELVFEEGEEDEDGQWIDDEENPGAGDPDVIIIGADNLATETFLEEGTFEVLDFTLLTPGSYLFLIEAYEALTQGYTLELDATERQALVPEEAISETFTLDTYDLIRGSIEFAESYSATLRIYNPDDVVFFEAQASGSYEFLQLVPGPGDYRVELINEGDESILLPTYEFEGVTDADFFEATVGTSLDLGTTGAYAAGERDYYLFRVRNGMAIDMTFAVASNEAISTKLFSRARGTTLREQVGNLINFEGLFASNDLIIVEVRADRALADGYAFNANFGEVFAVEEVSASASPGLQVSATNLSVTSTIETGAGCLSIESVNVDIDVQHRWISDLIITLTSPDGTTVDLRRRSSHSSQTLVGNIPGDFAAPNNALDALIGENGSGQWEITVTDGYFDDYLDWDEGVLNSWGVNVSCTL